MTVFVVLFNDYGDQGVDFCGVFSTEEKAKEYIKKKIKSLGRGEEQYFDIQEEIIQ